MIKLSIIIVNYNVKEFVFNLLNSIQKAVENIPTEVIIVDNASSDGSCDAIKQSFPDVTLIENKENIGFGKANNIAIQKSSGDYILLINPDTIVREDTFSKMIEFFEKNSDAGLAGCKVLNPDGTLQLACRRSFPGPWTSFTKVTGLSSLFPKSKLFARYNLTYLDENKTYEVDSVSGSFMMFKREVFEKTGGFDPDFFMYGEDLDLSYRVQQAGYKVFYVHETEIIHYKGESTKRSSIDETRVFYSAMHLFVQKHFSTSFIITGILRLAIVLRNTLALLNLYKIPIIIFLFDFLFFSASVFAAESIYKNNRWLGFPENVIPWVYFFPALLQGIISVFSRAYKTRTISVLRIVIALVIGLVTLTSLTYFFKQFGYSRAVVLMMYSMAGIAFVIFRIILKLKFKIGISSEKREGKTLIVGTDEKAISLANKLKSNISKVYHVEGLITKDMSEYNKEIGGYRCLGSITNISKVISDYQIERVIFTSEQITFSEMFKTVSSNKNKNVSYMFSGNRLDYLVGKSSVTMLDDIPLLQVNYNISNLFNKISKRLFDIFVSIPVLLFIFPFIYLISKLRSEQSDFSKFILNVPSVFKGVKSFVGPENEKYFMDLYIGKPGLTGYWFTEKSISENGNESEKLNLFYARNQSVWLDLELLGKSFSKMFLKLEL